MGMECENDCVRMSLEMKEDFLQQLTAFYNEEYADGDTQLPRIYTSDDMNFCAVAES